MLLALFSEQHCVWEKELRILEFRGRTTRMHMVSASRAMEMHFSAQTCFLTSAFSMPPSILFRLCPFPSSPFHL